MENRKNEHMIYLKDLLFAALYQWKKLLIGAVALAVLLGGFQGITGLIDLKNPETLEAITKQNKIQQERYEAEVDSLEKQIETLRAQVRSQQEYLDNSLLMQLEPYNFYEASLVVYVETDYQILPGMEYQNTNPAQAIIKAYESLLLGSDCLQAMSQTMNTEPRYLKELITITGDYESISSSANMMQITAKAADQQQAQQLQDLLSAQLQQYKNTISSSVASHTCKVIDQSIREMISQPLADQQKAENDRLTTLLTAQTTAQTSQASLTPPSLQGDNGKAVLKKTVIFAVIGGVLAVFFGVVILWVCHIASGKAYSGRTLQDRTGIKLLGALPHNIPGNPIDKKLMLWEGRQLGDAQAQADLLAVNIRAVSKGAQAVLLTGSADNRMLMQALKEAGVQAEFAGDILESAEALQALERCDAVILTEQCHVSRYNDVNRRMELIADYGKQLLGCVIYGG